MFSCMTGMIDGHREPPVLGRTAAFLPRPPGGFASFQTISRQARKERRENLACRLRVPISMFFLGALGDLGERKFYFCFYCKALA
jgi:hypothetical protein